MGATKNESLFLNLYPVWIILSSLIAFLYPPALMWFTGNFMVVGLSIVMLGMGFTLKVNDFKQLLKMPGSVVLGFVIMYSVMPISAWTIAKFLNLEPGLAVGLILLGCCPGGTASNVIAFIARANVALSVILTTASTLGGIIVKPLVFQALAGQYIPIEPWGIFFTMVKMILIPVAIGVYCNYKFPKSVGKISVYGPYVSVIAIIFIAGGIVAQSSHAIAEYAGKLFIAAFLLHILGFLLGYFITKIFKYDERTSRTISIETGMQNGGLAAVLAKTNFPMQPLVAVPAIFSSVIQTLAGGVIAAYWRSKKIEDTDTEK
ncbi:MAG: bile acid:sodium symporter family protein [Pedobacter sp.]|uniref:bile acid:sodium symporter family protein n=1 Tax=Pedobacter sp. TaxID=1411316 RepID=UPI002808889F|nr:bile acid:sodium symporter family protein [Pedobacter sp.]MDQ8006066.1 bile acid:sodium symporter family protein [Pedobacter sp.]